MSGPKGVLQSLPSHIQEIYTCSLPEFDTKANEQLEKILNEIEELQTA
jgi:hypothetical protein